MITGKMIVDGWKAKYDSSTGYDPETILINLNIVLREAFYFVTGQDSQSYSKEFSFIYSGVDIALPSDFRTTSGFSCGLYSNGLRVSYEIIGDKIRPSEYGTYKLIYIPELTDLTQLEDETPFSNAFLGALIFGLDRELNDSSIDPILEQNADAKFQKMLGLATKNTRKTPLVYNMG